MAKKIDEENNKTLRAAFNYIRITVSEFDDSGHWVRTLFNWTRDDLISVFLDLRGVETKIDNPELQASTIEVQAYYPGEDINNLYGKDCQIQYVAGYDNGTAGVPGDVSRARTFYCNFDKDSLTLKKHVLTIKGTDLVGKVSGENSGKVYQVYASGHYYDGYDHWDVSDALTPYLQDALRPFLGSDTPASFPELPTLYSRAYNHSTGTADDTCHRPTIFQPRRSKRKIIADIMNIFRGRNAATTVDNNLITRRIVFRDAGYPEFGIFENNLAGFQIANVEGTQYFWDINYSDVADLEMELDNSIKRLKINNPNVNIGELGLNDGEEIDIKGGTSKILDFSEPVSFAGFTITQGANLTATHQVISPYSVKITITGTGTGKGHARYYLIQDEYETGEDSPNVSIDTGLNGETITLEQPNSGLHCLYGYQIRNGVEMDFSEMSIIEEGLKVALMDDNLKTPKWINFTWRGNPKMQPRDLMRFWKQDGTIDLYEIDNLTLEHRDGGMISKVKALYKGQYGA